MAKRTCRYCGETGHNTRSCKEDARTTALAEQILPRLLRDLPTAIKKVAPIHSLEASMIECELTPSPGIITLSWHNRTDIWNLISDKIRSYSKSHYEDSTLFRDSMSIELLEGKSQLMSFFVTGETPNDYYGISLERTIGFLELDFDNYAQSMIEANGDNYFKKIWRQIVEPNLKSGEYSNYEGKEGALVVACVRSFFDSIQTSANSKRKDSGSSFFRSMVDAIKMDSNNTRTKFKNLEHTKYEGEWFNDQSPDIKINWVNDEWCSQHLSFKPTQALITEIESSVKEYVQKVLFKNATSMTLQGNNDWAYGSSTIQQLVDFMMPNYNKLDETNNTVKVRSPYFSSATVGGNFFFEENTPSKAVHRIMEKCASYLKPRKVSSLSSDFIKMAHSGGYNQSFDRGKMLSGAVGSTTIPKLLDVRQKCRWNGETKAVGYLPFYPDGDCSISISDFVNCALELYAFAEMSTK